MIIEIRSRFLADDPELKGDYAAIEIYVDGALVQSYGDYYHDKGHEKAEGFIGGWQRASKEFGWAEKYTVEYTSVADYEV